MTDIFVSYARVDKKKIEPLVNALLARGWSVWWDHHPPGETWERKIETALKESRCVIVIWSAASRESEWVRAEADEGKARDILVPVMLEDVEIPFGYGKIHATNLSDWKPGTTSAAFDQLIEPSVLCWVENVGPGQNQRVNRNMRHKLSLGGALGGLVILAWSAWYWGISFVQSRAAISTDPQLLAK